jgi:hypothetical protein
MNCETATNLLSARLDGEVAADPALDAHLAECAGCRAAAEGAELQDAALVRTFSARRSVANDLADRVMREFEGTRVEAPIVPRPTLGWSHRATWLGWVAVAAAVVVAIILFKSVRPPVEAPPVAMVPPPPVAELALATGEIFTCPSGGEAWQTMARGEPIAAGARVRTSDGAKCELKLPDGSAVRLNARTEATFAEPRVLQVSSGQLWSALPARAAPLSVTGFGANVTAGTPTDERGTQFDLCHATDAATVTVVRGTAQVGGRGAATTVREGEFLRVAPEPFTGACVTSPDPLAATRWHDELLILKPKDDPEVAARVAQLLARITAERGPTGAGATGPVEADLRAHGQAWSASMACSVASGGVRGREERRTAARLLADLATPSCIPDLIELLNDADGDVRRHAAAGLRRLTGQSIGGPPDELTITPDAAAATAWRTWWEQNKSRYPASR